MVGVIVDRYSKRSREVEIVEVESTVDGRRHLVSARDLRGGKVWLNTFDTDKRIQSLEEMVNRQNLVPVELLPAA
jgi:hypothetical protein